MENIDKELLVRNELTLDTSIPQIKNVRCVQNDNNTRLLNITITKFGKPFFADRMLVDIRYKIKKSDGTIIFNDADITSDGKVEILLSEQCMSSPGIAHSELQIFERGSGNVISTMKFNIIVEPNVVDDSQIESSSEFSALNNLIGKATSTTDDLYLHIADKENPHEVTKEQVGLGNVPNVATDDQVITYSESSELETLSIGETISTAFGKIKKAIASLIAHINDKDNPHEVTKEQVGLGNVDNKSSEDIIGSITSENIKTSLGYTPIDSDEKGIANGIAPLDENGLVSPDYLPSYVDDVLDGTASDVVEDPETNVITATSFILAGETGPCVPESGKIYLDIISNLSFRWTGSTYLAISGGTSGGVMSEEVQDLGSVEIPEYDLFADIKERVTNVEEGLQDVNSVIGKIENNIISDAWDNTRTYSIGEYCINENTLWKCLVPHYNERPSEGTLWTKVSVANSLRFKSKGYAGKDGVIVLEDGWNEVIVVVNVSTTNTQFSNLNTLTTSIHIPELYLEAHDNNIPFPRYFKNKFDNCDVTIKFTDKNTIYLHYAGYNGTEVSNVCTTRAFYR